MKAFKILLPLTMAAAFWFVASSSMAGEDGFDAGSIADFVEQAAANGKDGYGFTAEQYARRNFLYDLANRFRIVGAVDPRRLESTFAPGNSSVLAGLMNSKASRQAPGIWRYFFRQSLIYAGRVDAPVSRIGFYNPIVDGWVMTDWAWSKESIRLVSVHVLAGESLIGRGSRESIRIAWTRPSRLSLITRLRGYTGQAGLAFAEAHPMTSNNPPPVYRATSSNQRSRLLLEARLVGVLANLNDHYRDADKASLSAALIDAMKIGDKAALATIAAEVSPQSLHAIAGLPGPMRNNLELIGNFPTPSGAMMVFGMPLMSRWMMIARYTAPTDEATGGIDGLAAFEVTAQTPTGSGG